MKTYTIAVHGCDDSTFIEKELTDEEAQIIQEVANAITEASFYGCMPTMTIEEKK